VAYFYQVSFDIPPDREDELAVGSSLERVLGLLRAILPSEPGFTSVRAIYSLDLADRIKIVVQSVWDHWGDLEKHRLSSLAEDKILREFAYVTPDMLEIHTFREVD
jgi:hypothetical protein